MTVEEKRVLFRVGRRARGGGVSTEIGLRKGDAEGGVGGEVELGVALSPVFDNSNVYGLESADPRQRLGKAELSVAMTVLTGSVLGIDYPL